MRRAVIAVIALLTSGSLAAGPVKHWSFVPPARPPVPAAKDPGDAVRNPVDAFLLAALQDKGLSFNPPADRRALIRRVSIDLTGLPPDRAQIQAFLSDTSANAWEKLVDRLLASPQFGVRWAQHWLDVVRFAETNGYELDADRPQAWRYRDWVVQALNADMPYDRFLQLQIAGDLIAPEDFDARVATGFLRAGPQHVVGGNQDEAVNRQEWLTEAVAGIGSGILGLTIGCARCHDHKYDPLTQRDYYRLQACLATAANEDFKRITPEEQTRHEEAVKAHRARLKPIQDEIAEIEKPYREMLRAAKMERLPQEYRDALAVPADKRTSEQKKLAGEAQVQLNIAWDEVVAALSPEHREKRAALRRRMHAIDLEAPEPLPLAPGVADTLKPVPKTFLLLRGDPHARGPEVTPGFPAILVSGERGDVQDAGRLALARWITSPANPLTSRVIVNRVWHYLFGRGIVETPNDFGLNGKRPTHPALLDWLACELMGPRRGTAGGSWSLKRLIRLIVTSRAYRQSSAYSPRSAARDSENALLWRMNRKRLDAEAIRDSILAAAGTLNLQMGGPSIRVPLEPEVYDTIFTEAEPDNLWPVHPDPRQHDRRSLYLVRKRNVRLPLLAVFDQPDMMTSCGARGRSTHALQALTLMNSDFMRRQARALAERILRESDASEETRVRTLFEHALGRPPTPTETAATRRFLADQRKLHLSTQEPWTDAALALLNHNEMVTLR